MKYVRTTETYETTTKFDERVKRFKKLNHARKPKVLSKSLRKTFSMATREREKEREGKKKIREREKERERERERGGILGISGRG